MKGHGKAGSLLIIFSMFFILASFTLGTHAAWSAERVRQPIQRRPAPARAVRKKAPWQPVTPHVQRYERNRQNLRVLVQDIDNEVNAIAMSDSLANTMGAISELIKQLKGLQEGLRFVMRQIEEVRSLMLQAAQADSKGSISEDEGNRLRRDLQRKLSALERKRADLLGRIKDLENRIRTMTDLSQKLQMQLQEAMNKSQRAAQLISSIIKNYHDTLKAIINNMR